MFVIPCKYSKISNNIVNLVRQIREYHPYEKILVVDSNSDNTEYFDILRQYDVIIPNFKNTNWYIGAFWYAYVNYPKEDFYYFLHDSMIIKDNLDYLKNTKLSIHCHFNRYPNSTFNYWNDKIKATTNYKHFSETGYGVYGSIFFCQNCVVESLYKNNVHLLLPSNKAETGYLEGAYGVFFECEGFDIPACSLFGDVLDNESINGKSGPYPHNTSWQFPIEKFYLSHRDKERK